MQNKTPAGANGGLTVVETTDGPSLAKKKNARHTQPEIDLIGFPPTDTGNAERLLALFGQDVHYCPEFKSWMVWDRKRWRRDSEGRVQRMATETVRRVYAQAMRVDEKSRRDAVGRFARHSESAAGIRAMLECARSLEGISISSECF